MNSTIAAISTAPAAAGIGVVRLSGPEALVVADRIFRSPRKGQSLKELPGYTARFGHVYDREGDIDECVALVFHAPHSYTGENMAELSCHGGLYLLQRVLRAALEAGARPAGPGEFTRRAFVNGKIDLTRAEAVMDLIAADGRLAAKTALAAREGAIFQKLRRLKEDLTGVCAGIAAYVDYPDDDIPELAPDELQAALDRSEAILTALLSTFDAGRIVREGIDTVIAGSPNVGKSTLMNLLAGCERSIVTSAAGTTRDIVEETVRVGDVKLRLSDTAGIRDTDNEAEAIGVDRARKRMESALLLLCVFDGTRPLDENDRAVARAAAGKTAIALINKADVTGSEDRLTEEDRVLLQDCFSRIVALSALEGSGRRELEQAVQDVTGVERLAEADAVLATERQRQCAETCLACIQEARQALEAGLTLDVIGASLDGAIAAVGQLTGETATEAVVNEIFARFCVGK